MRLFELGGDTQADYLSITVQDHGETVISTVDAAARNAHLNIEADGHVEFDNCAVGFDLLEPAHDEINTLVDFRLGNKQLVTFDGDGDGNIDVLRMYFPATSGNFTLLVKQDGTGSRTIGAYRVYESDGTSADGESEVKWAGGAAPDLTDDPNHVDILSFFWDKDNEIAYGVATLDFQF